MERDKKKVVIVGNLSDKALAALSLQGKIPVEGTEPIVIKLKAFEYKKVEQVFIPEKPKEWWQKGNPKRNK